MDQQQPFPTDVQGQPAAAPVTPDDSSLGQGFSQTPEPTVEAGQDQRAPDDQQFPEQQQEQPQPQQAEQPTFTRDQYEEMQRQLQEKDTLLGDIQHLAEQQRQEAMEKQFRDELRGRLDSTVRKVMEHGSEEDVVGAVYDLINNEITSVTGRYQQQMNDYHQEVEQAFRAATLPGYADHLISEHSLPADVKSDLMSFQNERDMTNYALRVKATMQLLQGSMQQEAIQQQAQQRRDSGVYATHGAPTGPAPQQPIQPGTAKDLMPALREIFGV